MKKINFLMRNVAIVIVACLAVSVMFTSCDEDELPSVDEQGLTENIRNIIPDEYITTLKELGLIINGGNKPPTIEGKYLANPMVLVKSNTGTTISSQWDMYVTFSKQNNTKLTIEANYTMQSENGPMSVDGIGSYIIGEGKKFTVFIDARRVQGGHTAKTVEFFSGEIVTEGIKNFQWGVLMIDDAGDPLGIWIENGKGYVKKDGDDLAEKVD